MLCAENNTTLEGSRSNSLRVGGKCKDGDKFSCDEANSTISYMCER